MEIVEIILLSDNLAETEHFYSKTIGFDVAEKHENSISFKAGSSLLTFIKSDNLNPIYHFAFNIPRNRFHEAVYWSSLRVSLINNENGETVTDFRNWNAKAFYFYDNNGNVLEFIARFGLENESVNDFEGSSIQSISEIGIVADSPLKLAETLIKDYNVSYFDKGPRMEKFAVLGDDNGLLIISKAKRHWYPTLIESQRFYTKIKILKDGVPKEIEVEK
ncbi:MAG TPA: hypothetical protein VF691_17035 [Cytophagaceae bacterium]